MRLACADGRGLTSLLLGPLQASSSLLWEPLLHLLRPHLPAMQSHGVPLSSWAPPPDPGSCQTVSYLFSTVGAVTWKAAAVMLHSP